MMMMMNRWIERQTVADFKCWLASKLQIPVIDALLKLDLCGSFGLIQNLKYLIFHGAPS